MRYRSAEEWIRAENSNHDSVEDQIWLSKWFAAEGLFISDEELRRTQAIIEEVEDETEYAPKTSMDHLEEIGVLGEREPQGGNTLIMCERADEIFFTPEAEEFPPILAEEIDRFIRDMKEDDKRLMPLADGGSESEEKVTIRDVTSEALEVNREEVEEEILGTADVGERMVKYEKAVEAVKESDTVERGKEYDVIGWRNRAHWWGLSKRAEALLET